MTSCNTSFTQLFKIMQYIFCKDLSIQEDLAIDGILKFPEIEPDEEKPEILSGRSNPGEIQFSSKEDFVNMHRMALNETTLIAEVPAIIDKESVIIVLQQIKTPV